MRATAVKNLENFSSVSQAFGTVVEIENTTLRVRAEHGIVLEARRAISCLVDPELNDRVLLALGTNEAFVLAVLEREHYEGVTLGCEGDMNVRVHDGSFRVSAKEAVDIIANTRVTVATSDFTLAAQEGSVTVKALSFVGEKVLSSVNQIKTVAKTLDQTLDRFTQRVRNSIRTVQQLDLLRAEQIDHTADELYHLRARHALIHSEKVVKMDAEQIQLG